MLSEMVTILEQIKNLPDTPGVYFFKGVKGETLYIGKATSLRSRVRSYFRDDISSTRGPKIVQMLELAKKIDFTQTDSVLEALLLEAELIKKHQPKYNTDLKDDKSNNFVVITKEDFPRVLLIRGKELFLSKQASALGYHYAFGPFPHGGQLKEAMKIVRRIFPFRDKCVPGAPRPCFNAQIGLCPGVCTGVISKQEYAKTIRNIKLFFEGKKKTLIKKLEREMKEASAKQEFEKAGKIKKTIFALEHIQDVALLKSEKIFGQESFRIEAYDVAHISGTNVVGVMTVVEDGEAAKSEYRKFKIKSFSGADDTRALREILERRLAHPEWSAPKLIVADGGRAQVNTVEKVLLENGMEIPVVGVVKDERHRPREILGDKKITSKYEKEILLANAEAHRFAIGYHRDLRGKI